MSSARSFSSCLAVAVATLCMVPAPAAAGPVTFQFVGHVESVKLPAAPFAGLVAVGDPLTGFVTFDSAAIDTNWATGEGTYYFAEPSLFTARFGAFEASSATSEVRDQPDARFRIDLFNDWQGVDTFQVTAESAPALLILELSAFADSGAITSDVLPLMAPDVRRFEHAVVIFVVKQDQAGPMPAIGARIDSLTLAADPIPEPATLTLLSIGAGLGVAARRIRSRKVRRMRRLAGT
ncbi:MAG TPA: PEP-CTERM sorting domain-containing protein [Vicinamibacterales bacterium]|nr:PEP-CTERM sorting domain-containing protein [Vicinamibacterales bacterium]